jgi:hypothetical protein
MKTTKTSPVLLWSALTLCAVVFMLFAVRKCGSAMSPGDFVRLCASAGPAPVRAALDKGADPGAIWTGLIWLFKTDPLIYRGDSALGACLRNRGDIEVARMLLDAGVSPNAQSAGQTPLLIAIHSDRADFVDLLLRAGADPNVWAFAAHRPAVENAEIFALLLRAGADLRSLDEERKTILHYAARNISPEPVQALLAAGFDPNAADMDGNTPLHETLRSAEVVALLAKAGADVNRENREGLAPFENVEEQAIMDAFLAAGARLIWPDAHGGTRVRGFFRDRQKNLCRIRFFMADGTSDSATEGNATPVQKAVLAAVSFERPQLARPDGEEKYSEMFHFFSENDGQDSGRPIADHVYYIESRNGAVVFGRSDSDGNTARVYTPGPEELHCDSGEDAVVNFAALAASGKAHVLFAERDGDPGSEKAGLPGRENDGQPARRGEQACFAHPDTHLPLAEYPYFILSEKGYAIAGKTWEGGCSPQFFAPIGEKEAFTVYGGPDAVRMNVKGS